MAGPQPQDETIFDFLDEKAKRIVRISPSAIRDWNTCQFKYYAIHILKYREPANQNLFFGTIFDDSLTYDYSHKIGVGKDLPKDVLTDYFRTRYESEKDKVENWEDEDAAKLKEIGTKGIEIFYNEIFPNVQPKEVQPKLAMTFKDTNFILSGRPDLIEVSGTIVDNKTSGRAKPQYEVDQSPQALIYSIFKDGGTDIVREVRFDVLVKTKAPKPQQIKTLITPEYRQSGLRFIANVIDNINSQLERKNFPPTAFHRGSWDCGYCAVSDLCRKTWGFPVPDPKMKSKPPTAPATKVETLGTQKVVTIGNEEDEPFREIFAGTRTLIL